ncbi:MAG: hypothetical protein R3B41_04000 [Candidatus Doudnabacteria bacterium]
MIVVLLTALLIWAIASMFNPVTVPLWIILGVIFAASWQIIFNRETIKVLYFNHFVKAVGLLLIVATIMLGLGNFTLRQALLAEQDRNYDKSLSYAKISNLVFPFLPRATNFEISGYLRQHDYQTADRLIQEQLHRHPLSAGLYSDAGIFYVQMYAQTKDEFYRQRVLDSVAKMIELNPYRAENYKIAAFYLFYLDEKEQALEYVNRSLALSPKEFNSWVLLSKLYLDLGDRDSFVLAIKKANSLQPSSQVRRLIHSLNEGAQLDEIIFPYQF